jgi:hypothetical protein
MANIALGAGVRHAEITDSTGAVFDINAVINVEGSLEIESTEIKGDDEVKVTFFSSQKASLTVEANAWSLPVLAAVTGEDVVTIAAGAGVDGSNEIALGTSASTNPPFVQLKSQTRAKASDGTVVTIEVTFHKVQLMVENLTQALESEFPQPLAGTAYKTATDIEGGALASSRIATVRIVDADTTPAV